MVAQKRLIMSKWNIKKETPSELNFAESRYSIDVLAYNSATDSHTIAWYDYLLMQWVFLSNEDFGPFKWRYFDNEIDKF